MVPVNVTVSMYGSSTITGAPLVAIRLPWIEIFRANDGSSDSTRIVSAPSLPSRMSCSVGFEKTTSFVVLPSVKS